ncbi:heavy-metal-associated domain-containing protein [Ochrobactrum vermis]|uniref:Heavy-metal-associated domain-containing protein n=1 Tax=Ochrobactrum vermis TaxID=1827297 RepID=A0ABU8PFU2_9HYPH|nr:heavy-metal-associated domain-containing protein [Ochrobactrum vermis]PQZ25520.1 heavy metal transport/detoxification protein [Ochrobactrum vermis]
MYLVTVPNMTCGGCAQSVTKALQSVYADAKIETDPPAREVRVQTSASEPALRAVLSAAGYPVENKPAAA